MSLLWVLGLALAGPPDDGVFADPRVSVTEVGGTWRITVEDRVLEVEVPATAQDRRLVDALVTSLLTELSSGRERPATPIRLLRPPPPDPDPPPPPEPEPAPAPEREPEPEPEPEPAPLQVPPPDPTREDLDDFVVFPGAPPEPPAPPSRGTVWGAVVLNTRAQVSPGAGAAIGLWWGATYGVAGRLAGALPRDTQFATDTSLLTGAAEGLVWKQLGPVRASAGAGLSVRWYARRGERVARHLVPLGVVGAGLPLENGRWRVEPAVALTVDGARTDIRVDEGEATMSPLAVRVEFQIGRALFAREGS